MKENTVLIVDDNAMNSKMAAFALKKGGYNTLEVSSGLKALSLLEQEIPDLILLDVEMPEMDGFAVMQKLRENPKYRDIPVIFLTGNSDRNTEVRCFQEGAHDFISKPFAADVVEQRVNRTLELHKLKRQMQAEVDEQTRIAQERFHTIQLLSNEVITAMAAAIDAKDKYTNGHSKRVAQYSCMMAEADGKTKEEQYSVYCAAILHDIGKIGVPDEIINKPSRLTQEEYDVIKSHTTIGAGILKNITQIPEIVTGAHFHHERFDGKGYPKGLKGEEIPEIARIIGVADAYDAMSSSRSYRAVCEQSYVRSQIEQGIGTQFDPHFAKLMLEIIDRDTEYKLRG